MIRKINFSGLKIVRTILRNCFHVVKTGDRMTDSKIAHFTKLPEYEEMFWAAADVIMRAYKSYIINANITKVAAYGILHEIWEDQFEFTISKRAFQKVIRDIKTKDVTKTKRMAVIYMIMEMCLSSREIYKVVVIQAEAEGQLRLIEIIRRQLSNEPTYPLSKP